VRRARQHEGTIGPEGTKVKVKCEVGTEFKKREKKGSG